MATIVPDAGRNVWGAVWEIDVKDIPNLDRYRRRRDLLHSLGF